MGTQFSPNRKVLATIHSDVLATNEEFQLSLNVIHLDNC